MAYRSPALSKLFGHLAGPQHGAATSGGRPPPCQAGAPSESTGRSRALRFAARGLSLLAFLGIVAGLAIALAPREASSDAAPCGSTTSLELVGTQGQPTQGNPVIDLTGPYAAAETSVLGVGTAATASVKVPLDFGEQTVAITACSIEYQQNTSVAISGHVADILPGGDPAEPGDLLILATWPNGETADPVVSLGSHVNGDFDLQRLHQKFVAPPGLTPAFTQVWFTQSSGQQDPGGYAGPGEFYPAGHSIPQGIAFRGEVDLKSVLGEQLAGYLGDVPVHLMGGVVTQGNVVIYNNTLVAQSSFTLSGTIDLSGVTGLPDGISFSDTQPWQLTLSLDPTLDLVVGDLTTYGVQVDISGAMTIDKDLLGTANDLDLAMDAVFQWNSASSSVVIDLMVTAQGPWQDLFGMNGFSANSVKVLLRLSTTPSAQAAKLRVIGNFTANGFPFALTFEITKKNATFTAKVVAETDQEISVQDVLQALQNVQDFHWNDIGIQGDAETWNSLQNIRLNHLRAAVSFGTTGASVFITADAVVYGLQSKVAFYLGPDTPPPPQGGGGQTPTPTPGQTNYGFLFAIYVGDQQDNRPKLGDLIQGLPQALDITLPETIFYVSSLRLDADFFGFPDPELFRFFNLVYDTTEDPGAKITVEAGAGLLTNLKLQFLEPESNFFPDQLKTFLQDRLWMNLDQGMAFQGNVPLFGKDALSLFLYLPEVIPEEADHAPEWFERARLHLSMTVEGNSVAFKLGGELDIRLRKDGVPAPQDFDSIQYDDYDHFQFNVGMEASFKPPVANLNLTGQLVAPAGWHPLGQQWLTVQQLALVLNLGTTPTGNAKISIGLGGAILIGAPPDELDLEVSFLIGVQTLQVFPWATANIDGFRFQTTRGLQTMDLITLADFFSSSLAGAQKFSQQMKNAILASLPNIAIRDFEVSFAKVDNVPLCLTKGFTIRGYLYLNPTGDPAPTAPPCNSGPPPPCEKSEGCLGGINIEVVLTAAEPPKIVGQAVLNPFDIGTRVHIGPGNVDLEISQEAIHLMVNGQMAIDGVGSGSVVLKITPLSYQLEAEARLFNAFWAYLDADLTIVPPAFNAHGELKAEFGANLATFLESETRNWRALLMTLDQLYRDFQDPNKDLDDLTNSLLNLAPTLQNNGAQGPLIDVMARFADKVRAAKTTAENLGLYPSLDQIVNNILQGRTITLTQGVPGGAVDRYCLGWVNRWGTCIGIWREAHCRLFGTYPNCWIVPPITFTVPGICAVEPNMFAPYGCNSTGLKLKAADAVDDAFKQIFGVSISSVLQELQQMTVADLFNVNCAAFDFDLAAQGDKQVQLFLGITLLGKPVVWQGTWDFDKTFAENIGDNRAFLKTFILSILGGAAPDVYEECTHTAPDGAPPGGGSGAPTGLTVSAPGVVAEGSQFTVQASFSEPGVQQGDQRTYAVAWGDGTTSTGQLNPGQVSFNVTHTYDDDLPGSNDNRQVVVTVSNSRAGSASKSVTVQVTNVAPTAGAPTLSPASLDEGQEVTVTGSFNDPGAGDTHTVLVTWGDGSQPTAATVNGHTYTATHTYLDDNPTDTPQDNVPISIEITDDDGGKGQTSASLTVRNVAPQVDSMSVTPLAAGAEAGTAGQQQSGQFYEGDEFVVAGTFTDPAGLDTHSVTVEMNIDLGVPGGQDEEDGWIEIGTLGVPPYDRNFSLTLPLPDDMPSGTPEDEVIVRVTVEDDDTGSDSEEMTITLQNRDPEDVTVTVDPVSIDEDGTTDVTVEWSDAGIWDSHVVVIDWGDGNQTVLDDDDIEVGDRAAAASHHYRDDALTANPVDVYTITATVTDDDTGEGTGTGAVTVNDVPPEVSVDTDWQTVQYSDPIVPVLVTATDVETDPLAATTTWAVGPVAGTGDLAYAGLPDWLALSGDGDCILDAAANLRTCTWTLSPQLSGAGVHSDADPGIYTVRVKITDDDTLFTERDIVIKILPEDAKAYYVGPTFAATELARDDEDCSDSDGDDHEGHGSGRRDSGRHGDDEDCSDSDDGDSSPKIELRANVRDVTTAVEGPDAPWDPYPGDIRNATVIFVDKGKSPGEPGYELCSAPVDTILREGGEPDTNIGTAACVWQAEIGVEDAVAFKIGVVISGRYTDALFPEQAMVTVARPFRKFITGGGCLVLEASEGAYAGDDGSHVNFGFNVKFNRDGTELRGRATVLFRVGDRTYKIKATSFDSLGVVSPTGEPPRTAQFEARARLYDVTDHHHPILLGSELSFQMRMTDMGEPHDHDDHGDDEDCPDGDDHDGHDSGRHDGDDHDGEDDSSHDVADSISFTLWEGSEGRQQRLLLSSAWDGNRTVEQLLAGGNLKVHGDREGRR